MRFLHASSVPMAVLFPILYLANGKSMRAATNRIGFFMTEAHDWAWIIPHLCSGRLYCNMIPSTMQFVLVPA
jgi:high-affinity nickel permease